MSVNNAIDYNVTTYRQNVNLPYMPSSDKDRFDSIPTISMPRAELVGENLVFNSSEGFDYALEFGFFLVKIPETFNLGSGDNFVRNFFKQKQGNTDLDKYRGFKEIKLEEAYQGYFDREFDQWENFYIESTNWEKYLTPDLCKLGHQMTDFGISILKNVLQYLDIPNNIWKKITGGLAEKKGHHMLAFNHFRADKAVRGSKFHRDSGWVTVLRSWEPGLVVFLNNKIYAVNPVKGYFIVNFGSTIEVLTEKLPNRARANIHGVVRTVRAPQEEDRFSYVVFLDSNLAEDIYQLDENKDPKFVQTVQDFAIQEVTRTYDENDLEL